MNNHQREIERASMRYFISLATSGRRDILKEIDVDYGRFLAAIRIAYEAEKNLPSTELLNKRLKLVRVHVMAPKLGKAGKIFTLRHWPEARKLKEQGASYREIVEYLKTYRKFKISQSYLKRLMVQLDD